MTNSSLPEINIFDIPVHADADLFPMIPDDEMAELAEDIKENGLNEPIVISRMNGEAINTETGEIENKGQWILIDGRNRREACRIAGIVPDYRVIEADPKAYIVSANINRRHMTKGQRAMAVAMMYPDEENGGRGKKAEYIKYTEKYTVSKQYISNARIVLKTLPNEANQVLHGGITLTDAYKKAQSEIAKSQTEEAKLDRLKKEATDLYNLVVEGTLGLDLAIQQLKDREDTSKAQRAAVLDSFCNFSRLCELYTSEKGIKRIYDYMSEYSDEYEKTFNRSAETSVDSVISFIKSGKAFIEMFKGDKNEQ